jgi:Holliday junction DNA helicase RuvA
MISYLVGRPFVEKDFVTMLCGQVGYAVRVTDSVKLQLLEKDQVELFIYTHVREDLLELFGFIDKNDRELFLLLIGVSGVGPKTALQILNVGSPQIIDAVQQANTHVFAAVPRVGKKLAQKIIIDLRTKLGALKELDIGPVSVERQEVIMALQALGFEESRIIQALQEVAVEEMTISDAVKKGIQQLGQLK